MQRSSCAGRSGSHNEFNCLRDRTKRTIPDRSFLSQPPNEIVQQNLEEFDGKAMKWRLGLLDTIAMAVLQELAGKCSIRLLVAGISQSINNIASQRLFLGWLHMALAAADAVAHQCRSVLCRYRSDCPQPQTSWWTTTSKLSTPAPITWSAVPSVFTIWPKACERSSTPTGS